MGNDTGKTRTTRSPWHLFARLVGWTLAALIALPLLTLIGAWIFLVTPENGDRRAQEISDETAEAIAEDVEYILYARDSARHAEYIAYYIAESHPVPGRDRSVEVLGWDGSSGEPDGSRVDFRITARYEGNDGLLSRKVVGGNAVTCYHLTTSSRPIEARTIACTEAMTEPNRRPEATPPDQLESADTADNEKRLLLLLNQVSPDDPREEVVEMLEEVFPDHTVQAQREDDELVATVMGPTHRACLVGVREGNDEAFRYTNFPKVQLEHGELGCGPALYWSDVTAH